MSESSKNLINPALVAPFLVSIPALAVTPALNEAAPAAYISNVKAETVEPPSLPLMIISLSDTFDSIITSLDEL